MCSRSVPKVTTSSPKKGLNGGVRGFLWWEVECVVGKRAWLGFLKAGHMDVQWDPGSGSSYLGVCVVKPPQFYPGGAVMAPGVPHEDLLSAREIAPSDFSRAAVIQRGRKHLNRKFSE